MNMTKKIVLIVSYLFLNQPHVVFGMGELAYVDLTSSASGDDNQGASASGDDNQGASASGDDNQGTEEAPKTPEKLPRSSNFTSPKGKGLRVSPYNQDGSPRRSPRLNKHLGESPGLNSSLRGLELEQPSFSFCQPRELFAKDKLPLPPIKKQEKTPQQEVKKLEHIFMQKASVFLYDGKRKIFMGEADNDTHEVFFEDAKAGDIDREGSAYFMTYYRSTEVIAAGHYKLIWDKRSACWLARCLRSFDIPEISSRPYTPTPPDKKTKREFRRMRKNVTTTSKN